MRLEYTLHTYPLLFRPANQNTKSEQRFHTSLSLFWSKHVAFACKTKTKSAAHSFLSNTERDHLTNKQFTYHCYTSVRHTPAGSQYGSLTMCRDHRNVTGKRKDPTRAVTRKPQAQTFESRWLYRRSHTEKDRKKRKNDPPAFRQLFANSAQRHSDKKESGIDENKIAGTHRNASMPYICDRSTTLPANGLFCRQCS